MTKESATSAVTSDFPEAAGAPENEIEITPEMLDAGCAAISRFFVLSWMTPRRSYLWFFRRCGGRGPWRTLLDKT
jgi:hypothetical protein